MSHTKFVRHEFVITLALPTDCLLFVLQRTFAVSGTYQSHILLTWNKRKVSLNYKENLLEHQSEGRRLEHIVETKYTWMQILD